MRKLLKIITLAVLMLSMSISLTGCGEQNIHDATKQEYNSRIDENLRYVEQLKKCGAITEDTEKLLKQYFRPWDDFMKELEKMGKNTSRLDSMTTHVYSGAKDALGGVYSPQKASTVVPWGAGGEMDKGLSADNLFKMQDIVIWKAKYVNNTDGIDELTKAITQIQEKQAAGDSEAANTIIDNYFENTGAHLFPDEVPLLKATEANGSGKNSFGKDFVVFGKKTNSEGNEVPASAIDVRMLEVNKDYVDLVTNSSSYTNSGGKYLIINKRALLVAYPVSYIKSIKQDGEKFMPQFEKSNMLLNLADGNITKYDNTADAIETVHKTVNNSNKVYMATVDDINILLGRATADTSNTLKTITTEISEIDSGQNQSEDGGSQASSVKKKTLETIVSKATDSKGYKMDGSKLFSESNKASNSSFLMMPNTKESYRYKEEVKFPGSGDDKVVCDFTVECNRIVLKDYLEFVATPGYTGYTGAGNYTPLGRRIRFTSDVILNGGASTDTWAMYIDNSGSNMFPMGADTSKTTIPIRLEDIVGSDGNNEKIKVLRLNANGESAGKTSTEESLKKKVGNPGAEINYVTEMELAFPFPSSSYGGGSSDTDMVTNGLQPFYGVKVNKDIYETSLFSSWLTSGSDTNGSQWWNNWLSANGYAFSLDLNELLNNKDEELSYEREKKNNIVLDMNVIENIQRDIDKENGVGLLATIRTIFTVLGIILIFYGLLLPCGWLFDTNVLMGPKFMTILTFGKWVAVKDKDESMTNTGGDGPSYVNMKDAIIGGVIVMAIGILCVSFDVVKLVVALVKSMSSLVRWVWGLLFR